MEQYNAIYPGKPWYDTNGKRIQAHGGSMLCSGGKFYWYGENKEKTFGYDGIWHWGVRLYSSVDLYNWQDEGIICLPQPQDAQSPLYPNSKMDRPHILYNAATEKYILWMKIMGPNNIQYMVVAQADHIQGHFELVNKKLHPGGMNSGDFDLVQFPDGRACIVFDRVHTDMVVIDLTPDYLDTTVQYSSHYYRRCPPYVREAPAVFFRKGQGYIFTSGTTGYFPNPTETACFEDIHGHWKELGTPHMGDTKKTSFDSQISCVFKHPDKKDLYIAMADRWLTDLPENRPDICDIYKAMFDSECALELKEQYKNFSTESLTKQNISVADYVWLPLCFEDNVHRLYWQDSWRIEDYD